MSPPLRAQVGRSASSPRLRDARHGLLAATLCMLLACTQSQEFTEFDEPDPESVGSPRWRVKSTAQEHVSDLALIDASLVPASGNSFTDFVLKGGTERAALVAALPTATSQRVYGRLFSPRSLGGGGWDSNPAFKLIDSAGADPGSIVFGNIALGFSAGGDILSVFSDNDTYLRAAMASSGEDWNDYNAISAPIMPTNAVSNMGRSSDILWDSTGQALWAYITGDGRTQLKVRKFSYDSGWNSSAEEIHLGTEVDQVKLLDDGYNKIAVWRASAYSTVSRISAGMYYTCAIENEDLKCWGLNSDYQLSNSNPASETYSAYPIVAQGIGAVSRVATGSNFACAITRGGEVYCWGSNTYGQLGVTGLSSSSRPVRVTGLIGQTASRITAGDYHACAILGDGTTQCWGRNNYGQLGRGSTTPSETSSPSSVLAPLYHYSELTSGDNHTCGLVDGTGEVECWGDNSLKQIGNGSTFCGPFTVCATPTRVLDTTGALDLTGATQISAFENHSCALVGGKVACWGANGDGQLGRGDTVSPGNTEYVCATSGCGSDLSGMDEVAAGGLHSCARNGSAVYCWGRNDEGQLGDGQASGSTSTLPVAVSGLSASTSSGRISLGYKHSCAIDENKVTKCWGDSTYGQLGTGNSGAAAKSFLPTANQATVCNNNSCLLSATLDDPDRIRIKTVAAYASTTHDIRSFDAGADSEGNTVVAFVQYRPDISGCSSGGCDRLYGSVRSILGNWSTPVRIDADFDAATSTLKQGSSYGPEYPVPAVTEVSPGNFLVVTSITETTTNLSGIFSFGYETSLGWKYDPLLVGYEYLAAEYRYGNQLTVASDGEGNAITVFQTCLDGVCANGVVTFADGAWNDADLLYFGTGCDSGDTACTEALPPQAHVFPSGEKVIVYAAPLESGGTDMRLQSLEYY